MLDEYKDKVAENSQVDGNGNHKLSDDNKENYAKAIVNWQKREYKLILKHGEELAETTEPNKHFDDSGRDKRPERRNSIKDVPAARSYYRKKST